MDATRLRLLHNPVRSYPWGSPTAIPELLGIPSTGEPQAELWMGAHASAPSRVLTEAGEEPLDEWIRRAPEAVLGEAAAARYGGTLPFLFKVLAAARPLSIQAHPNLAQARAGFDRENGAGIPLDADQRCYRDANHKPELICALTEFRALNRFRDAAEILARFDRLGLAEFEPLLEPLRRASDAAGIAAFFEGWMALPSETCRARVELAVQVIGASSESDPAHRAVLELCAEYPGDPGVLAPLFLNVVTLAPGQAMYLPAGELHGYLGGVGIELMANSDNVLRGGLTSKHVDVPELLGVLTFASGDVERLRPEPVGPVEQCYATPAEEFALSVLRVSGGSSWTSPARHGAEILLCTEGSVALVGASGDRLTLGRGASALAPAAAGSYRVESTGGAATVYRASGGGADPLGK